jgi:proteic killer suppression protein
VIVSFKDGGTQDLYDGVESPAARKSCPKNLWSIAQRKLDQINRAADLGDLTVPPGNMLEKLKHDRKGQMSIRINQRCRICFLWKNGAAYEVEIVDYH